MPRDDAQGPSLTWASRGAYPPRLGPEAPGAGIECSRIWPELLSFRGKWVREWRDAILPQADSSLHGAYSSARCKSRYFVSRVCHLRFLFDCIASHRPMAPDSVTESLSSVSFGGLWVLSKKQRFPLSDWLNASGELSVLITFHWCFQGCRELTRARFRGPERSGHPNHSHHDPFSRRGGWPDLDMVAIRAAMQGRLLFCAGAQNPV